MKVLRYLLAVIVLLLNVEAIAKTASEVFDIASKSTVIVIAYDDKGNPSSFGSGVVLSNGQVATNCHVIAAASNIVVYHQGQKFSAFPKYTDQERDVCTITVPSFTAKPVILGQTKGLKIGAQVYAIGAPEGLELTLSEGIVSGLREVEGGRYVQATAPISPGSSGGGLFDENGCLIGLTNFFYKEGQNLNFALPVEWIIELPMRHNKFKQKDCSPENWIIKATELIAKENWDEVLLYVKKWTESVPSSSLAWIYMGIAYGKLGQMDKVQEVLQMAIQINPEDADIWHNIGSAYSQLGMVPEAVGAYQKSLSINPNNPEAWGNLGAAYHKTGQISKAVEAYQQALRIDPEFAGGWNDLGTIALMAGQTSLAIEAYHEALRIDPCFSKAWAGLGNAHDVDGQISKAIEAYQQALRIDPEYADVWYNIGIVYKVSGQTDNAMKAYRSLKAINPAMAEMFFSNWIAP